MEIYPGLAASWQEVGTKEQDGTFVFRDVSVIADYFAQQGKPIAYKDLTTGKIIKNETVAEQADIEMPKPEN